MEELELHERLGRVGEVGGCPSVLAERGRTRRCRRTCAALSLAVVGELFMPVVLEM